MRCDSAGQCGGDLQREADALSVQGVTAVLAALTVPFVPAV